MNKNLIGVALVAVLVIAIGGYMYPKFVSVPSFGADAGPVHTEAQEFQGGVVYSNVNSTSSVTNTLTLAAGDLAARGAFYDTVRLTQGPYSGGGATVSATTTWTFPASSTLSNVLPRAGMRQSVCFGTATTTGKGALVLAEGTGFAIHVASSTVNQQTTWNANNSTESRTIRGGTMACGWVIRGFNEAAQPAGSAALQDLVFLMGTSIEGQ